MNLKRYIDAQIRRQLRGYRGMRRSDRKAYALARRIRDLDIRETVKSKLKEGATAVAGAMDWVSSKIKEKVDPAGFASEKEARLAEKQKLKDLSTVKGLLKEIFRLTKAKVSDAVSASKIGSAIREKAAQLIGFIKGHLKAFSVGAVIALIGIILKCGRKVEAASDEFEEVGPQAKA